MLSPLWQEFTDTLTRGIYESAHPEAKAARIEKEKSIHVFREGNVFSVFSEKPRQFVRIGFRSNALEYLQSHGVPRSEIDVLLEYATPLPTWVDSLDYAPGEKRPYRIDDEPTTYDYARMLLMRTGMTRRQSEKTLRAVKRAAEIGGKK